MAASAAEIEQSGKGLRGAALHRYGLMCLLGSALLWSTSGLYIKAPPFNDIPLEGRGILLACLRSLFAAVALLPWVSWNRARFTWGVLCLCVCMIAVNTLYVTAVTRTTAGAAIFLQYTSAAWATLLGGLFLGDIISRKDLVALVFILFGIGWIVAESLGGDLMAGNLLALGASLGHTGCILCFRWLRNESTVWLVFISQLVTGLVLLPLVAGPAMALTGTQLLLIAGAGCLLMAIPYLLFGTGVRYVSTQESAMLPLIEPVLNPIWVYLLWGESLSPSTLVGAGLILAGLIFRFGRFSTRKTVANV